MNRTLLLDFDGVILRHHGASRHIARKSEKFANFYLKLTAIEELQRVNKEIYKVSGHTSVGLQKLGFSNTLPQFNEFVYSDIDYDRLLRTMPTTNVSDIQHLTELVQLCESHGIQTRIFSNAPDEWCKNILSKMSPALNISSVYADLEAGTQIMKPDPNIYDAIELRYPDQEFFFVDDKLENLIPVCGRSRWTNILLDNEIMHMCKSFRHLKVIKQISHIKDILFKY